MVRPWGRQSTKRVYLLMCQKPEAWRCLRNPGRFIVLENEEPDGQLQMRLAHTEFVGLGEAEGRRGFFPI